MDNQSLWYLENIDMKGLFCPKKVAGGKLDSLVHKSFEKGSYIYLPNEHADRVYFIN
jgi:hypothetical protein